MTTLLQVLLPLVGLSVALAFGVYWARSIWEETHEDIDPASVLERLDEFEQAHAEGTIDDAELERIRAALGGGRRKRSAALADVKTASAVPPVANDQAPAELAPPAVDPDPLRPAE